MLQEPSRMKITSLRVAAAAVSLLILQVQISPASWQQTSAPLTNWAAVASSADGTRFVAVVDGGLIYSSTDAGGAWTATTAPNRPWKSVACSGDGILQVSVYAQGFLDGRIYFSRNSGDTWTLASAPKTGWYSVASSADGTHLAVGTGGRFSAAIVGPVYTSIDSGLTWFTLDSPVEYWTALAMSADGSKVVAAAKNGGIYTLQTTPSPSLSITVSGGKAVISWMIPSMSFELQETSNPIGTNWTQVGTLPSLNVTNLHKQVTLPVTGNSAFYQLKSL
jgi:hypothetical protein